MRVLFVGTGLANGELSNVVMNQGESLKKVGIELEYFPIYGKGFLKYILNVKLLKKRIKKQQYDIIHAHYALSALTVLLAGSKVPCVVSFMGCDLYGDYNKKGRFKISSLPLVILSQVIQPFFDAIIVKSANLARYIYMKKKMYLIPNGVDLDRFVLLDKAESRKKLGLNPSKKYILFLGNKADKRKNFALLLKTYQKAQFDNTELLTPFPIHRDQIPVYLAAADVLVLTSYNEGSPNIIKEAMACNCPIVATDVGDVKKIIGQTRGCYLTDFDVQDLLEKILKCLKDPARTNGRENIRHMESKTISNQIINLYKKLLQ